MLCLLSQLTLLLNVSWLCLGHVTYHTTYIWYGLHTISVTLELQHGCECPKMLSNKQVLVKDNNMQV